MEMAVDGGAKCKLLLLGLFFRSYLLKKKIEI